MNQQQPNQQPQTRREIEARIIAKAWKDESYKQELLSNPKAIFEREFGVELPEEVSVQVLEENATTLNFVLPMAPQTQDSEISEEQLEAIAGGKGIVVELAKESFKMGTSAISALVSLGVTT
ncbi:MAG: NHLP leader peptide family RiPP precursor [Cyanobacteria bacterium P01_A01_bin.83]